MTGNNERRARVQAGSRRKRDLEAVKDRPPKLAEQFAPGLAWAKANLPSEHGPFVAVAARMLRRSRITPTSENVMARLRDQGRTRRQLR